MERTSKLQPTVSKSLKRKSSSLQPRTSTSEHVARKLSSVSRHTVLQIVLAGVVLTLLTIIAIFIATGIKPTAQQEAFLEKEAYEELLKTVTEAYPLKEASSYFAVQEFNARKIVVFFTNQKKINLKVKCAPLTNPNTASPSLIWDDSSSTEALFDYSNPSQGDSATLILNFPKNHSYVFCSLIHPKMSTSVLDSLSAPLHKLNEVPFTLYLPIESDHVGLVSFNSENLNLTLLKRKYVSSSCSLHYTEDYLEGRSSLLDASGESDFHVWDTRVFTEKMNSKFNLHKRLFNFNSIVDSWKLDLFNKMSTSHNEPSMPSLSYLGDKKVKNLSPGEIAGLQLKRSVLTFNFLYYSDKAIEVNCGLYTGAKEKKEQNLPLPSVYAKQFTFHHKDKVKECNFKDGLQLVCLFFGNSPIFESHYLNFPANENTADLLQKEFVGKLVLLSKYTHFIMMSGDLAEYKIESIFENLDGKWETSLVNKANENKVDLMLKLVMFIAETVNRMKSPMRNTHSSLKILKFKKMKEVLKSSVEMLREVKNNEDGGMEERINGLVNDKKKYIEL